MISIFGAILFGAGGGSAAAPVSDVMMQAFYWDVPVEENRLNGSWWNNLSGKAQELKECGISAIWTPVPSKGNWGIIDNGYGIYDHYDLGNYLQKGSVETRFGSRAELENMISIMHQEPRIEVYSDVVLNHIYSNDENEENNPSVKEYVFSEANAEKFVPYPAGEIRWVIPNAAPGDYYIQIKGYCLPWTSPISERGYDLVVRWDDSDISDEYEWENELNDVDNSPFIFPGSGTAVRAHIENESDIDEYKISLGAAHDIEIRITPKRGTASSMQWEYGEATSGYYPKAIWHNGVNLAETVLEARTNTRIYYPHHSGKNERNYEWNYSHFHPSHSDDWLGSPGEDEVATNTKFFGNDTDTFNHEAQDRLIEWGKWLVDEIGFDGFRLDFVRGFQEEFAANWIKNLPRPNCEQPFVVGEYWGRDFRIKDWVERVADYGADVKAFDFPLKNILTDMCNQSGKDFDMSSLSHAGMIRNGNGHSLPASSVVTFLENHDTGKEHDKWVVKDFELGYAYILTHEGRPCIFYPHFFGVTQNDVNDKTKEVTSPPSLKEKIKQLINVRETYLGGETTVLSETGNPYPLENTSNIYIARRQGNGIKDGAIIVLNNDDFSTKTLEVYVNSNGLTDWSDKELVNLLQPTQTIEVNSCGRAVFYAPPRGYSVWVLKEELE